jgi:hypothetical protein
MRHTLHDCGIGMCGMCRKDFNNWMLDKRRKEKGLILWPR